LFWRQDRSLKEGYNFVNGIPQVLHMPRTTGGKLSLGLIAAMPVLFFIGGSLANSLYRSVPAGNSIGEDIAARPALALTMLAGTVSGISAFITGIIAIARYKERAALVYGAVIAGALLLLFLMGELFFSA
jgi:hypothetical protein